METAFPWLVIFAVGGTLVVLVIGVLAMLKGGGNARRSNRIMRYRLVFQFSAIALIALAFIMGRGQ
ncbi:MAG: twin transmembrane helix small protein [Alphaproteobacteria bacterium]